MLLDRVLLSLFVLSLIIWVGGAITGQIWMFRAGLCRDKQTWIVLIPQINWIIRSVYIPMAATAFTSGVILAWRNNIAWTTPWLLFPIIVFVTTIIVGAVYSLPEYARLVRLLHERTTQDVQLQRRIETAAWVNRIELFLVLAGIIGIIIQPGF